MPHAPANFRCCLVGEADLAAQCAQSILDRGGHVACVATSHAGVRAWAAARSLVCYRSADEAAATREPIDYLFSIVNPALLKRDVLRWPARLAINYHNGPLPRYAGVHATSWAILNGETTHGIAWHVMEPQVDAGATLARATFPIAPRDTAFDLNVRCHEHALATFETLLDQLNDGRALATPQDAPRRTYFGRHAQHADAGVLRWDQPAEQLDRVVRAHALGTIVANTFGSPKVLLANGFFVPADLAILGARSTAPPGTASIEANGALVVSTATHDVRIERARTIDGAIPVASALGGNIGSGDRLPTPASDAIAALIAASQDEPFCVEAFSAATPSDSPFVSRQTTHEPAAHDAAIDVEWPDVDPARRLGLVRLAVLIWLGRSNAEATSVRYSTDSMLDRSRGVLLRGALPLTIALPPDAIADDADDAVAAACEKIERHGVHAADAALRYKLPADLDAYPVALHVGDRAPTTTAKLGVALSTDASRLRLSSTAAPGWRAYTADDLAVIAGQIVDAIRAIAARPNAAIASLDLLSPADHLTLRRRRRDDGPAPVESIPSRWAARVRGTPDAVALVASDRTFTYRELDARSDAVADRLISDGICPSDFVGVCIGRSAERVAAILGVLKAGGAYVPIAADLPPARRDLLIRDATLRHVVTLAEHRPLFDGAVAHVLAIDEPTLTASPTRQRPAIAAWNPAYVNFTSGSTGAPKGVVLPHAGVVRLADASELRPDPASVVLHAAPLSFDAATLEIWGALLNGVTLVLLPPGPTTTAGLAATLRRHRVDTLFLTTTLFNQMVDVDLPAFAGARHVMTGGEAMSPAHARRFVDAHPNCRLSNLYGPTENTSISTAFAVPRDVDRAAPVPIGRPILHSRAFVLDRARRPVPAGIVGELYVAGVGLAIGYLNRPDLTAERFVDVDGQRAYRTGDAAWLGADGTLHFIGRADRQVKVRGHRIEPAEIEAAINEQPGVASSAVVARDGAAGGRVLAAYVVPQAGARLDLVEVRRAIAARLPGFMVPGAWLTRPALPLSANGKLDAAALPAPAAARDGEGRAPSSPLERTLCELFAQALSRDRVGVDDDFFALGGHSLRAAELAARARETLGVALPLRTLFEHPTVAGLIAHLPAANVNDRPPLVARPRPDPMPLSPTQRRLWFLQQLDGPSAAYNIRLAYRLDGEVDAGALRDALADLTARHEILRTIYPARAGVPFQRVLRPDEVGPPFAAVRCVETELPARLRDASDASIDVSAQPPLRARLFMVAPDRHVLLLVLHHIACDGWSLRPFWADLSRAYGERRRGASPAMQALPLQYADYALWQRAALGDAARDPTSPAARQLAFWRAALQGVPETPTLATDFARPAVPGGRGAGVPLAIDARLHARLARVARESNATLFMVLQAGLAATLSRELAAGDDIVIGTPVAGRDDPALNDQIGLYANTLALRLRLGGQPTFRELVGRARAFALDAYANQDVPFDEVVGAARAGRSARHHPLFQVMFALDNTPAATPAFEGVAVRPERIDVTSAKFDLLLALRDEGDADGHPSGIAGGFEYDADLFRPATIRRLAARWAALLEAAVAEPDRPMSELPVSGADLATTLPDLLAAWGRANRPALLSTDRDALTHAALATLLARLAAQLGALGIGPGDRVAIVLPNGPAMAVTFLAVAGVAAAAAPLNPAYRAAEFAFFLDDLNARALIVADGAAGPAVDVARARGLPILRIVDAATGWRLDGDRVAPAREFVRPEPSDVALLLHTSGTTARPKLVPLSHENLCESARNVARSLALTPDDLCLNVMPLFHIHGLVAGLLSSLGAGAAVICSEGFDATKVLPWLRRFRPTWYTAVPTMHAAILDRARGEADARAIAPLRLIRSSSSALPPTVAAGLEDVFGVPVIEAYGMTEAAHQMCCNPLPPLMRKPGSVGRPAGPEVAIMDGAGNLVPPGGSGEVAIRGRNVTAGYAANDKANAEAFSNGWFRTGDLGHVDADGYLFLSGRSKEIINRGGEKISPREIDEALLAHPSIAAAVAFAMPDARLGEEVAAAIVLRPGATLSERDVVTFAAGRLADFKVPRRVIVLDELPKGATGKVQRVGLAKTLGLTGEAPLPVAAAHVAPRNDTELRLAAIWSEVLGRSDVGIHDRFVDLGGDSVLATQVVARVRELGLGDLPIVAFFDRPTIATMAEAIAAALAVNASLPNADERNLETLLAEIEGLSDDEVERLLAKEQARDGRPS